VPGAAFPLNARRSGRAGPRRPARHDGRAGRRRDGRSAGSNPGTDRGAQPRRLSAASSATTRRSRPWVPDQSPVAGLGDDRRQRERRARAPYWSSPPPPARIGPGLTVLASALPFSAGATSPRPGPSG